MPDESGAFLVGMANGVAERRFDELPVKGERLLAKNHVYISKGRIEVYVVG